MSATKLGVLFGSTIRAGIFSACAEYAAAKPAFPPEAHTMVLHPLSFACSSETETEINLRTGFAETPATVYTPSPLCLFPPMALNILADIFLILAQNAAQHNHSVTLQFNKFSSYLEATLHTKNQSLTFCKIHMYLKTTVQELENKLAKHTRPNV